MSEKSIIAKIKALMAKTIEAGATEAEALAAMSKAHELLAKYQLTLSDLDLRAEGTQQVTGQIDARQIIRYVAKQVALYCDCRVWSNSQLRQINFLGLASDAQFAHWLASSLTAFVQRQMVNWQLEVASCTMRELEDFQMGIVHRINERLKAENARKMQRDLTGQSNALVVVKNAMVQEAFSALGMSFTPSKKLRYNTATSAFQQGRAKGDEVNFNRPLQGGTAPKAIGGTSR